MFFNKRIFFFAFAIALQECDASVHFLLIMRTVFIIIWELMIIMMGMELILIFFLCTIHSRMATSSGV